MFLYACFFFHAMDGCLRVSFFSFFFFFLLSPLRLRLFYASFCIVHFLPLSMDMSSGRSLDPEEKKKKKTSKLR